MRRPPSVLIVIVTWEKRRYVVDLLAALDRLEYPRDRIELLVVDNASTDGTVEAIGARWPQVRILRNANNLGGSGGFNTGLAWALRQPPDRFDYVWLLDNDVVVHPRALSVLVDVLESDDSAGVAGSTMLQLDCPWRINEMGAAFDADRGRLLLRRHLEEVDEWRGRDVAELQRSTSGLPEAPSGGSEPVEVDYVAAASLLVRSAVVREAGLWRDFFIHFDDVEWCLRIRRLGWRVLVAPGSLIWHLSAARKVPSWVLYYDNRNVLFTLREIGASGRRICRVYRRILLKALYHEMLGKHPHALLHLQAVDDFAAGRLGRRDIAMEWAHRPLPDLEPLLTQPGIRSVAITEAACRAAPALRGLLRRVLERRPGLRVAYICPAGDDACSPPAGVPGLRLPAGRPAEAWFGLTRFRRFDLVVQAEGRPKLAVAWLARRTAFVNDDQWVQVEGPKVQAAAGLGLRLLPRLLRCPA